MTRVVLLGVSVRALAEPVARRRRGVMGVDFFGDRDGERTVPTLALSRDLGLPSTAAGLVEAARLLEAETVVYCADLENHPDLVDVLARHADVAGNGASVLREVRDPRRLREACSAAGIDYPQTLTAGEEDAASPGDGWLVKRLRSGGGHGVRAWSGERLVPGQVLQREVEGTPASVAFVADGRECRVFGTSEQLSGRAAFGADGYTWCGNIAPFAAAPGEEAELERQVRRLSEELTRRFGLRGVNGADLVVGRGAGGGPRVWLLEVNPRYSASMELAQRARGLDVLELHLAACAGRLAEVVLEPLPGVFSGKAVVYSRAQVTVPCTDHWLGAARRDVPYEGQRVGAGHPVCSVLAGGTSRAQCLSLLEWRAEDVYTELDAAAPPSACSAAPAAARRPACGVLARGQRPAGAGMRHVERGSRDGACRETEFDPIGKAVK